MTPQHDIAMKERFLPRDDEVLHFEDITECAESPRRVFVAEPMRFIPHMGRARFSMYHPHGVGARRVTR